MSSFKSFRKPVDNKLLAAISKEEYARLLPHLELVCLPIKQVLHEANEPIEYAYFPLTAAVSVLNLMEDGEAIEAAAVGNEGMVGIPLLLGTQQIPTQVITQIPGKALRMKAEVFIRVEQDLVAVSDVIPVTDLTTARLQRGVSFVLVCQKDNFPTSPVSNR